MQIRNASITVISGVFLLLVSMEPAAAQEVFPRSLRGHVNSSFPVSERAIPFHGPVAAVPEAALAGAMAEDLVVGFPNPNEVREIGDDFDVDGNIMIVNNGRLRISGARLRVKGNIHVFQNGGFEMQGGQLEFQQDYLYQRSITLTNKASLWLNGSTVQCGGYNISCGMADTSVLRLDNTEFGGGLMTTTLAGDASVNANGSRRIGELLFFDRTQGSFNNCDQVLTWLTLPSGSMLDGSFPGSEVLGAWHFPDSVQATGYDYAVSWSGCTNLYWGLMLEPACEATIRDANLLAVGALFRGNGTTTVSGLVNNAIPQDFQYPAQDRDVRFLDCDVTTWNLYPLDSHRLTVQNCIFGEILAMGSSDAVVQSSICDGTGGYVGCRDDATLMFAQAQITAAVLARDRGQITLLHSSLQTHVPHAADNGVIALFNSTFPALPTVESASAALVMGVDEPKQAEVDSDVRVHGSMRFLAGDTMPVHFVSHWFDAVRADEPDEIVFLSRPSIVERHRDTLGTWDTRGHAPGIHYLRLHMRIRADGAVEDDTISLPTQVMLTEKTVGVSEPASPSIFGILNSWPNPVSRGDALRVQLGGRSGTGELRIIDMLGRSQHRQTVSAGEQLSLSTDILPAGTYILTLSGAGRFDSHTIHIIR